MPIFKTGKGTKIVTLPDAALNKVTIEGYKSIRSATVELRALNVLIGANGAGKSNFISMFRLLSAIVRRELQLYVGSSGGANSILFQGSKITREVHFKLEFGENQYECSLVPNSEGSLIFSKEYAYVWDTKYPRPYDVKLGQGHKETRLFEDSSRVAKYTRDKMAAWTLYHFHDTGVQAAVKQPCSIADNLSLRGDAGNLAAYLMLIKERHEKSYKEILDAVRLAAPFFDDFILRQNPYDADKTRLEWRQKGSESVLSPGQLSDGTLRFICLAVALLQPTPPPTIVIDEPELGLHPYAITLLAGIMQSTAARRQVIVSTQSVPLVNQFAPEDLIVVDRIGAESMFNRLDSGALAAWLDDYGMGDLWEKNVIGGRPSHA